VLRGLEILAACRKAAEPDVRHAEKRGIVDRG